MSFVPTPHPYFKIPDADFAKEAGAEKTMELLLQREELIQLEKKDPFHHGIEPEHWQMADEEFSQVDELLILGGNRSGKSCYASKRVVKCINDIPEANVLCMHTTASTSVEQQQQYIHQYLPSEWKQAKKGKVTNLTFSKKGGFTESCCVAPNGSRIFFRNYSQSLESGVLEGSEWDMVWADELCPLDFIHTLRFRLTTRSGLPAPNYPDGYPWRGLLLTFTPITGYTPVVREFMQGASNIKTIDADPDLLPKEKVPVIQQPLKENTRIVYFHSVWNKFNDYNALKRTLKNDPKQKILIRAYGLATATAHGQFPRFGDAHLVNSDQIPEKGTNYMIVDPSHGKNWVMIWVRVAPDGKAYVYREFPSQVEPIEGIGMAGEWAVAGKKIDGDVGLAQASFGFSLAKYKQIIEDLEGEEEIFLRIMDSRFGASPTPTKSGMTTLIDQMADLGMFFEPSVGVKIEEGVTLINDLLDYNPEQPIDSLNTPRLFVHEECKNLRFALSVWTGRDGKTSASKDFVDVLRYYCLSAPTFIDENEAVLHKGGYY